MNTAACAGRLAWAVAFGVAVVYSASTSGQTRQPWGGVLDDHPSIQYARRPTTDRAAKLNAAIGRGEQTLRRDDSTGYLRSILDALNVPVESQLLVFSKTGVQSAYTSPHNPRALFFDESMVVAYVPGAPVIELAAHDPQQGVVFYTLDQKTDAPALTRRTSCLACHVSASTLNVPGYIARSNTVDDEGNVMAGFGSTIVDHRTPHPDRWGGWFVTLDPAGGGYGQRAHGGNITFSRMGNTSNQVLIDWLNSAPESRGYLSSSSDIVTLLAFDHQAHAINLITRLNWESRIGAADGGTAPGVEVQRLSNELADYFLFVDEAPPAAALVPQQAFAERLAARIPADHLGRSFGELDGGSRLLRYPCSYMIYSEAFDALPSAVKSAVYSRMNDVLSASDARVRSLRLSADQRRAVLDILKETKPDFTSTRSSSAPAHLR